MVLKYLKPDPSGWLPANSAIAKAVVELDEAFDRAFNNFGNGSPEIYLPLLQLRVHEDFPNMSALFLHQLQIDARERQRVQDAVAYAQPQVNRAVAALSTVIVAEKNLINGELGAANERIMGSLRPETLTDATQARIVLVDLHSTATYLERIPGDTLDSLKVPVEHIEKWIEHVKALGPQHSGDQMVADDQARKDTLAAKDPGLKDGSTTIDKTFDDIFSTGDGVFLGRTHRPIPDDLMGQVAADQIMKHGNEIGAVFLEIPESYQTAIDKAMRDHRGDQIPLSALPPPYQPDIPVINAAMKAGVKVVAVDDEIDQIYGNIGNPKGKPTDEAWIRDRLVGANARWAGVVRETMTAPEMEGKKALIVGGASHSNTDGLEGLLGSKYYSVDLANSAGEFMGKAHNVAIAPDHAIMSTQNGLPSDVFDDNATVFIRVR